MDRRRLIWVLGGVLAVLAAVLGYTLARPSGMQDPDDKTDIVEAKQEAQGQACASAATYDRLKQQVFEEAIRIRNADPANLELLATNSVVRMENPVVKGRDEELNATVCSGRFVLELPPGAGRAFGGQNRLAADIEYIAQEAADGSGLVYQLKGAEPIVQRLAAFDLRRQPANLPPGVQTAEANAAMPAPSRDEDEPAPAPAPARKVEAPAQTVERPQPAPARIAANPSFNCRYARTRGEKMVCGSSGLAARDRAMASLYFSSMDRANSRARRALRQTRDRFLAYRDRCPTEACVADAYEGRIREIQDIMEDLN